MAALTMPQTALDLQILLQERLEMQPKEFERKFNIEETEDKLVLKIRVDSNGKRVWLERHVWTVTTDYVKEVGGTYYKPQGLWEIPLKNGNSTPIETPIPLKPDVHEKMDTTINNILHAGRDLEANGYDLKKSKEALGTLIPILTDVHGNIIDGFHREHIDADWPKVEAKHITDPVQLSMARLAANVCRRNVPPEEKTKLLANIAELTGWDAKEIAEALGMSYQWVTKYLPETFKHEEMRNVALQRRAYSKPQDTPHPLNQLPPPPSTPETPSFESESITPTVPVEKIDTGVIFECPTCGWKATHIHMSSKHHKLQEVQEF